MFFLSMLDGKYKVTEDWPPCKIPKFATLYRKNSTNHRQPARFGFHLDSDRRPKTLISLNIAEHKRALCRKRSHKDAEGSIEKAVAVILGIEKSDMLASAGGRA